MFAMFFICPTDSNDYSTLKAQFKINFFIHFYVGLDIQPDEDDYGYVSHEASQLYKKLIDKYNSKTTPEKVDQNKGKSQKELSNAKVLYYLTLHVFMDLKQIFISIKQNRVKDALHKIEEESAAPHKRHSSKSSIVLDKSKPCADQRKPLREEKEGLKRARSKVPPPEALLSFDQILKLAATKQHEPVKFEKKISEVEKKEQDRDRLMTQKERDEQLRKKQEELSRQQRKIQAASAGASALKETTGSIKPSAQVAAMKKSPAPTVVAKRPVEKTVQSGSAGRDQRTLPQSIPVKPVDNKVYRNLVPKTTARTTVEPTTSKSSLVNRKQPPTLPGPGNKGKSLVSNGSGRFFSAQRDTRAPNRAYKRMGNF